ncbi:MAG TPA: MXAN_5187 family protein [Kofleriaceae bacterium]|nr:MXAN_5187 family protein [Kofleriaceae bacterium]
MFFSKIWFFVIAVLGAIAFTIALVMPRPAQRAVAKEENRRLTNACGVVNILLADDARNRVDLAGSFARTTEIQAELESASGAASLDDARMKKARSVGESVMKGIQGARKPDWAMLIDKKGRVVARIHLDDTDFGDVVAGRPLVDDALAGYLRDDLWADKGTMYLVSASPVVKRDGSIEYVGAVVLGHQLTNEFAKKLVGNGLLVDLGFYLGSDNVAASQAVGLDQKGLQKSLSLLKGPDVAGDCVNDINKPLALDAGAEHYLAVVSRLPGEAGQRGAFYSVFIKNPPKKGFGATLGLVTQEDLAFSNFPWILVAGGFLLALAIGIGLMMWESDRPLRRLAADSVRLAKGEIERLGEDAHPGKFGSIARSVNIHIDKLSRDAKAARKDMDQLLGPAPEGSLGTIDLLATALPAVRPGGPAPAVPPPPSEFRFGDSGPVGARPPVPPARPGTPPPVRQSGSQPTAAPRAPTPLPFPAQPAPPMTLGTPPASLGPASSAPLTLDDDILGPATPVDEPRADSYYKQVFDQFVSTKKSCNESTSGLTLEKFTEKLMKNRDDLIAKTGCREVRFTVYVKDGKAALKATPVKDE